MSVTRPSLSLQLRTFSSDGAGGWSSLFDQAVAADSAGVAKVVVSDHVAFGEMLDDYGVPERGGVAGGRQPTGPDGHWLEPITVLAMVAARTTRVRLGTNILLAALRRPAVLAKQLATLDVLSGGRLDIGVGVGWQQVEYEACGLDFASRGRQLDHTLEVCNVLWAEPSATYDSAELSFAGVHAMPKPLQVGGIPVWVSGTVNPRSMHRLARFGQGWIPWGPDATNIVDGIAAMRVAVSSLGRDPADIQVVGTLPVVRHEAGIDLDATMAGVPDLAAAGVTDFRAHLPIPGEPDEATQYLRDIVRRFDTAVA